MNEKLMTFVMRHNLSPDEAIAFYMIKHFLKDYDSISKYRSQVFSPSKDVLVSLIQKGLIVTRERTNPDVVNCVVNPQLSDLEAMSSEDMGEELWAKYPAALPLSGGGMFIARKGPDKYEVIKLYLQRINYSEEKHKFVLEQLQVYIKLVLDSKINGHRIHDWISNEMWDIIPALQAGSRGEFKTDI